MQLSPLQSRLAASLAASLALLLLYLLLFAPSAATAFELKDEDHRSGQPQLAAGFNPEFGVDLDANLDANTDADAEIEPSGLISYLPNFSLFDRSILGRADGEIMPLKIQKAEPWNLQGVTPKCFIVSKEIIFSENSKRSVRREELEDTAWVDDEEMIVSEQNAEQVERPQLRSRADKPPTLYVSANTCLQPTGKGDKAKPPPQLLMFVSNSTDARCPASKADIPDAQWTKFDQGSAQVNLTTNGDVLVAIVAPDTPKDYTGLYNFEVAASMDSYFHKFEKDGSLPELLWMDSDSRSALLLTRPQASDAKEAEKVQKEPLPFEMFVHEKGKPSPIEGLLHSICGLEKNAKLSANRIGSNDTDSNVRTSWTTRGPGGLPKQQFLFQGLNASTSYEGILVKMYKNDSDASKTKRQERAVTDGGLVYSATPFNTTSGTNCRVVTDLEFCSEIQYAAPGNDDLKNTDLALLYDNYARKMYANFEKVLMQIPCEAPSTERYSLTRNCTNCKDAYKRWLCTVSIPRCEDFQSDNSFAIVRNAGQPFPNGTKLADDVREKWEKFPPNNSSRNSFIDESIKPGPYKELLPCDDICYEVIRSCPAQMGLSCPQPRMTGYSGSYAGRDSDTSIVRCNYPGEARTRVNSGHGTDVKMLMMGAVAVFAMLFTAG